MKSTEYQEQIVVFEFAYGYGGNIDERLRLLHPIENTKGAGRPPAGAVEAAGVPDLCLPVAVHKFHGLYIELKTKDGKPSAKQKQWQRDLRAQGYASEICYGADKAIETLLQYLDGDLPPF
jgi:hypothetical protein